MEKMSKEPVSLADFQEGQEGIIHAVLSGKALASRLAGMGIIPSTKVKVLRSGGGPVIV
jgi:Fe2+ transport system protein FeoA